MDDLDVKFVGSSVHSDFKLGALQFLAELVLTNAKRKSRYWPREFQVAVLDKIEPLGSLARHSSIDFPLRDFFKTEIKSSHPYLEYSIPKADF
jgi:hypothetical protein